MNLIKLLLAALFISLLAACGSGTTVIAVDSNNSGQPDKNGQGSGVAIVATGSRLLQSSAEDLNASSQIVQVSQIFADGSEETFSGVVIISGAAPKPFIAGELLAYIDADGNLSAGSSAGNMWEANASELFLNTPNKEIVDFLAASLPGAIVK